MRAITFAPYSTRRWWTRPSNPIKLKVLSAQRGKGERDIHRRPFEVLPIPRYNSRDKRHRKLAKLSRDCHTKVEQFLAHADERWRTAPIGRLRTELRQEHLPAELDAINALTAEILNGAAEDSE